MGQKTIREISVAWKEYKQPYVKQSTMAAYVLILENHILPNFGESDTLHEQAVQEFVLQKIENGLNVKSVKDILIVLKMVMKFGVKSTATQKNCNRKEFKQHSLYSAINSHGFKVAYTL